MSIFVCNLQQFSGSSAPFLLGVYGGVKKAPLKEQKLSVEKILSTISGSRVFNDYNYVSPVCLFLLLLLFF